ncbi:hypothetical protein HK105_201161 [Polyrhizophydium stewartii]|uniref:mRNA export factor GLE1 n=1 Tax=Polyrhizophydium stewartii TaxID=2732419 RepID=A0ABR4NJ66_9FUNG
MFSASRKSLISDTVYMLKLRSTEITTDINCCITKIQEAEIEALRKRQEEEDRIRRAQEEEAARARLAEEAARRDREKAAEEAAAAKRAEEKQAQDRASQAAAAATARAAAEKQAAESAKAAAAAAAAAALGPNSQFEVSALEDRIVSADAWAYAEPRLETINRIKTQIKPAVTSNPATRNALFKAKMTITQRTGQLTRSQKKVIEIARALDENFKNCQADPQLYELVMDMTAKQIIKQAATEVAVKRNMAFPLAIVCVLLFQKHAPFLDILMGRFMRKCPYIAPLYFRKMPGESMTDYQLKIGYKEKDEGVLETEIQYGERMCGILSLYAAIVQTKSVPNNYGISNGWTWIARILNMKPRRITPLLLHTFLEVAGHELLKTYPRQAPKLIRYMVQVAIPMMPASANASTTRLKLFLEETALAKGTIDPYESSHLET